MQVVVFFFFFFFFSFTALYYAAKLGNKDIVSLLLSYSPTLVAPPVVEAYTVTDPLQIACCNGHLEVAKLLIKAGIDHFYINTIVEFHICKTLITPAIKEIMM